MPDLNQNADLVARLRKRVTDQIDENTDFIQEADALMDEAADALASQAAEITRLREAIKAENEACAAVADDHAKAWGLSMGQQAKEIAAAIRARTALNTLETENGASERVWVDLSSESYPVAETVAVTYFDDAVGEWALAIKDAPIETSPWTHFMRLGRPKP